MKKILVAIDGSENSKRALMEAKNLAECMSSKVKIINVISKKPTIPNPKFSMNPKLDAKKSMDQMNLDRKYFESLSETLLREALIIFQDFSGEVTTAKITGNPALEIIKEAQEGNYDLIVMGSRGQGFFKNVLGSTTNKVLNNTDKNVLTVQ